MVRRVLAISLLLGSSIGAAQEEPKPKPPEFDFGLEEDSEDEEDRRLLPFRGALRLEAAHGAGENPRWHRAGPAIDFLVDWSGHLGQVFAQTTLRYNQAFRWEDDPESVIDARSLEGLVRELYWKKSFGFGAVTAGNAIVAWGEGDILTPSDVVSRRDTSLQLARMGLVVQEQAQWDLAPAEPG